MIRTIEIENLHCLCSDTVRTDRIAYILYPMDMLADWVEAAATRYDTTIVVVTGMDWQNVFSPWPAAGVPKGPPDFKGESPEFLKLLVEKVVPQIETVLGVDARASRTLFGVSMSGLFALWQWMVCDTFANIASLSGSFWYEGFLEWIESVKIPAKGGKGYFLLGDRESKSKVKAFDSVAENTRKIIALLRDASIDVEFQSVPGDHYSDPILRLDRAFGALYLNGK